MKYSSSNKPLVCMQTQSTCYKGTKKMTVKGILWHSTGANNPTLKRYVQPSDTKPAADTYSKTKWLEVLGKNSYNNDWNHIKRQAGLNAWIGKLADGSVTSIQTMPWDYKPWGCGSGKKGSCNDGWIQFEICEDGLTDKTYFNKAYNEACELTAYLCQLFNIDPNGTVTHNGVKVPTILCHQDSYKLGLGCDHSDIYNWFPKHDKDMTTVRKDVAAILKAAGKTISTTTATTTVKTYKVVTTIKTYSTAADAKSQKNSKGTYAAGTYYVYNKYPDGVDGMINISTDKTGASAGSWINPKENVIKESASTAPEKLYYVRKSKDDTASQKGTFSDLNKAKDCCQKAGTGYHVFDSNYKIVYSYKAPAITLSSIAVTTKPSKTTYFVGESYNGSGLIITATYSDKSTKTVTGYTTSGFSSAKAGTTIVSVTFEGKTCTFTLTVKEKEVVADPPKVTAVYDLNYPEKNKIVDKSHVGTNTNCTKAIKKILSNNSSFDVEIAKVFFKLAPKYGIDPMMVIAQSILETGWFKYAGSAVTADQHNYCGLGVTSTGVKGAAFDTIEDGVTAQLQHLYAYGCKEALPAGDKVLDPRFSLVTRGVAQYWQQLAGRWACPGYDTKTYSTPEKAMAAKNTYGQKIRTIYEGLIAMTVSEEEVQKYFPIKLEEPVKVEPEEPKVDNVEIEVDVPTVDTPIEETPVKDKVTENPATEDTSTEDIQTENKVTENPVTEDTLIENTPTENKTTDLMTLIFNALKKLVVMIVNLFTKGD